MVKDLAFADQRERAVRERREVSARTDRAARRHHRCDARIQHRDDPINELGARAGVPCGERARAQQHHAPHDLFVDRIAGAGRV